MLIPILNVEEAGTRPFNFAAPAVIVITEQGEQGVAPVVLVTQGGDAVLISIDAVSEDLR